MKQPFLSIVIPCLNENQTIASAIKDAQKNAAKYFQGNYQIIVADNGSVDGSISKIKKFRSVKLVHVPVRGYGAALHWGILKSKGKYVLFADADMSYPFSNIHRFAKALEKEPDLILGSRMKGTIQKKSMPSLHRYVGTPILTWLIRVIYRIPTTDCNSGMRIVKKDFYKKLNMRNAGMEWASELLIKTALSKGRYAEVPIKFAKDKRIGKPHLSSWSDGWRHLKAIILLKPSSMYPFFFLSLFLAWRLQTTEIVYTFLFSVFATVLLLSILTAQFLNSVIERDSGSIYKVLSKFKLVPLTGFATLLALTFIFLSQRGVLAKTFVVSQLGIVFIWIFLVETVKTHLVNRLPDQL